MNVSRIAAVLALTLTLAACGDEETPQATPTSQSPSVTATATSSPSPTEASETAVDEPDVVPDFLATETLGEGIPFAALPDGSALVTADDEVDGISGCEGVELEVPWLVTTASRERLFPAEIETVEEEGFDSYTTDYAPSPNGAEIAPSGEQILLTNQCEGYLGRMYVADLNGSTIGNLNELVYPQDLWLSAFSLRWAPGSDDLTVVAMGDFDDAGQQLPSTAVLYDFDKQQFETVFEAQDLLLWWPLPSGVGPADGHVRVSRSFDGAGTITVHDADGTVVHAVPGTEAVMTQEGLLVVSDSEEGTVTAYDLDAIDEAIELFEGQAFDLNLSPWHDLVAFTTPEANASRLTLATLDGGDTKRVETAGFGSGWFWEDGVIHAQEDPAGRVDDFGFPRIDAVRITFDVPSA